MAALTLLALVSAATVIVSSRASRPWFVLDDAVIDVLHAGNLFASIAFVVAIAFLIIQLDRRTQ